MPTAKMQADWRARRRRNRTREPSRPRDGRPGNGPYLAVVAPPSRDVRRQRFARWVTRALVDARARGLTVPEIERRTRVSKATFYRWRAGEWTADPRGSQVRAFADGLGIAPQQAYDALGWSTDRVPEPEPPMDPDVRLILHALASPDVSEHAKVEIRAMLRMIAELHRRGRRREAS